MIAGILVTGSMAVGRAVGRMVANTINDEGRGRGLQRGQKRVRIMRILYIDQYFKNLNMAGGCRSFVMGRWLVEHGHTVNILTSCNTAKHDAKWTVTNESGISVHWVTFLFQFDGFPTENEGVLRGSAGRRADTDFGCLPILFLPLVHH